MGLRKYESWLLLLIFTFYTLLLLFFDSGLYPSPHAGRDNVLSLLHSRTGVLSIHPLMRLLSPAYIIPFSLLATLFFLNYRVIPAYRQTRNLRTLLVYCFLSFLGLLTCCFVSIQLFLYQTIHARFGPGTPGLALITATFPALQITIILSVILIIYQLVKTAIRYLYVHEFRNSPLRQNILRQVVIVTAGWLAASLILYFLPAAPFRWFNSFFTIMTPAYAVTFFIAVYSFMPRWKNGWRTWLVALVTIVVFLLLALPLFSAFVSYERLAVSRMQYTGLLTAALFLFGLLPAIYFFFEEQKKNTGKWTALESSVTRTSAKLDFLRSQINPHFLFNALNTIYGTALGENASRTAEGIQKLGDMMRFMLKENQHEKIALQEEITYLQHYIDLQKLRTEQSPDIDINFTVLEQDCDHRIAPMLLIPFVENAFKHGISLREPSWIRISIACDETHVHFDAYNSIHRKDGTDPEKDFSGIGLGNVQQRLKLLYPQQHELNIRQTNNEFFVHLSIRTGE